MYHLNSKSDIIFNLTTLRVVMKCFYVDSTLMLSICQPFLSLIIRKIAQPGRVLVAGPDQEVHGRFCWKLVTPEGHNVIFLL